MNKLLLLVAIAMMVFACKKVEQSPVAPLVGEVGFIKVNLDTIHAAFDPRVQETSGLIKIGDTYWTHNDSGGEPNLYEFDLSTGDVIRSVKINNVLNTDWEEVTVDSTYFYIGNFGNNLGKRKDLAIYKGSISELLTQDEVDVEVISFSYPDQDKFYNGYNHNHDCEAMIAHNDNIYLFSKNWLDKRCKLYTIPSKSGNYEATLISEFNTEGTITGAAISPDKEELILLGYVPIPRKGFDPFVWKLSDWEGDDFLSGEKKRYDFHIRRQMEAVVYQDQRTLFISAEDENGSDPSLYKMNL